MKITSGAFLIALLLSLVSSSVACALRAANAQDAKAATRQDAGIDDSSLPAGWKRYNFDKPLAFSIILPKEPEQQVSTFSGGTETSHVYISTNGSGAYGLTYINNLPAVANRSTESGHEFFFNTFIKEFIQKLQNNEQEKSVDLQFEEFKITTDKPVVINGVEGLEWNFSGGPFQGRAQLARAGQAGFCLIAVWKQTTSLAEQDAFFKSFKVLGEGH